VTRLTADELRELFDSRGLEAVYYAGMDYGAKSVAALAQYSHSESVARNVLPKDLPRILDELKG
jgi:hypothetical protein